MRITSLHQLFEHEIQDMYSAEQQILKALPDMIAGASDEELKSGFKEHLEQTKNHAARLEEVAKELEFKVSGTHCSGMEGVLKEGKKTLEEEMPSEIKDAAIIGAAQRVEHYEMAGYHSLVAMADVLGYEEAVDLLSETLGEEMETSEKLEGLAEGGLFSKGINEEAAETE